MLNRTYIDQVSKHLGSDNAISVAYRQKRERDARMRNAVASFKSKQNAVAQKLLAPKKPSRLKFHKDFGARWTALCQYIIIQRQINRARFKRNWETMVKLSFAESEAQKRAILQNGRVNRPDGLIAIINQTLAKYNEHVEVTREQVMSPKRRKVLVCLRREVFWRAYRETDMTLTGIARYFEMDHTTVLHAVRQYERTRRALREPEFWRPQDPRWLLKETVIPLKPNEKEKRWQGSRLISFA
jgi:hypothetical protein